jgi:hypothetical protein
MAAIVWASRRASITWPNLPATGDHTFFIAYWALEATPAGAAWRTRNISGHGRPTQPDPVQGPATAPALPGEAVALPIPLGPVHCPYCRHEDLYLEQDRIEFDTENGLPLIDPA